MQGQATKQYGIMQPMQPVTRQEKLRNSQWVQVPLKVEYRTTPYGPERVLTTLHIKPKLPLTEKKIEEIKQISSREGISYDQVIFNTVCGLLDQDTIAMETIHKRFPTEP